MIPVHIITTKREYVTKVKAIQDLFSEPVVRIEEDVCIATRMMVPHHDRKRISYTIQLDKLRDGKDIRKYAYINRDQIVAVHELDTNGPFYGLYLETVSGLKLVSGNDVTQ